MTDRARESLRASRSLSHRSVQSLLLGLVAIAPVGCRDASERAAMAHEPTLGSEASSAGGDSLPGGAGVTLHRLWTSAYRTFQFSSISPDGRWLSMVDWSTIDLAVRDMKTGELHRLTNAERASDRPYEDAGVSVFSADGERIVFGWQVAPDLQLRVIDFDLDPEGAPRAAKPSVIFDNPEYEPYFPFDWSPDGSRIVAKVWMGGQETHTHTVNHLAFISTVDGTYQALKSFDWREPLRAAFSPDGRYVAYDFPPEDGSPNRDIYVVSTDGSHEERIVAGPGIDRLLDWHPNGSVLFYSDRGGSPGVWRLPISEGRAAGPPELLKADMWGIQPLGSGPGRFYYGVDVNPPRLYTAVVDLEAGRLSSLPATVVEPSETQVRGWAWSPDGDYLAYSATTPGAAGSVIGITSPDGIHAQTVRVELEATSHIRWDPAGRSIIASTVDSKARRGFFRIDLESGAVVRILNPDGLADGFFDVSPDGRTIYYGVMDPESTDEWLVLVSCDLRSGEETRLGLVGWPGRVAVSPDGSRIAAVVKDPFDGRAGLGTIPVAGGQPTVLHRWHEESEVPYETFGSAYPVDLTWTPNGESLLYFTARLGADAREQPVLWSVDVQDRTARRIEMPDHVDPGLLRLHPDGRRVAFMAGESRGEVWVMEGLGAADPEGISEDER